MNGRNAEGGAAPALRLSSICKRFGPLLANDNISLDVGSGEVVALLGENGAGKTTLMNILFGHYVADGGSVEVGGRSLASGDPQAALRAGIGMVHQHFTLVENMSVAENVVLGTESLFAAASRRADEAGRIESLCEEIGLGAGPGASVGELSVGERQRVEIVKALYRNSKILILDEPTAVLAPFEIDSLFEILRRLVRRGLSVIFISHKLAEAMAISDRIIVLRKGRLVGERAPSETTPDELASMMVGEPVALPQVPARNPGPVVLELRDVSTASRSMRINLDRVSLSLRAGRITGIAGVAGNGQAALASVLSGTMRAASGRLLLNGAEPKRWSPESALAHGVARIPEDRLATGMIGDMSVVENMIPEQRRSPRFSRNGLLRRSDARRFAEQVISEYGVACSSPHMAVRLLSGGNIQKLILGRALDPEPQVVIANQPTRGLDVGAVAHVQERLLAARGRGAAVLLISEDLEEVMALSDKVSVMSGGRLSPETDRGELGIRELGALMARKSFDGPQAQHAA